MSWGNSAAPINRGNTFRKPPTSRLSQSDNWTTATVNTLSRGSTFSSTKGFQLGALSTLRLPSIQDITKLYAGSNKIGTVLSIIQSLNTLKTAFNGTKGLTALTKDVPTSTASGIAISTSGKITSMAKLGRQSESISNISGVNRGIEETARAVAELEQAKASGGMRTTVSSGSAQSTKSFQQPYPMNRNNGIVFIEIDGNPLDETYTPMLQRAVVHLTHEHRMSRISLTFNNDFLRFTNDPIWDEYKPIRIHFGYKTTGFRQVGGTFYSLGPKLTFSQGDGSVGSVEVVGVSEEFMMGLGQERITWTNMTDAQIVQQIAAKYGFLSAVQDTQPVWGQVSQVNQSDWDFIEERAEQYGYQVYIQDGILHFHKPIFHDSGIKMVYFQGPESQLSGFSVWGEPLQNGNVVEGTQIDPIVGNSYGVMSSDTDDPVSQVGIGNYTDAAKSGGKNSSVRRWSDIVSFGGKSNKKYVYHSGRDPRVLQTEVQGFSENSRWVMKGMAKVIGIEWLRARDSVELAGVGRASGLYYMTDVWHRWDRGIYTNEVGLTRTWKGGAGRSQVENKPNQLVEVKE